MKMSLKIAPRWRLGAVVAAIACGTFAPSVGTAGGKSDAEAVIAWNKIIQANEPAGVFAFRTYAMTHIAMFDAINSIERRFEPYHVRVSASSGASAEAAAAQAAHDVLVAVRPAAANAAQAELKSQLAGIPPGRLAQGVAVGRAVAQAIIDWRTGDGFEQPDPAYSPPNIPGLWQRTPPGFAAPAAVRFGIVEPFGLLTPTQYLPKPPPLLNSAEYAADFEQVKSLGSKTNSTRTDDQTLAANLFAAAGYTPNPFALWSNVAIDLVRQRRMSLLDSARLFALINAAMNDGIQTAHTSKYIYNLWRPVTAIHGAATDSNDATTADAGWEPLLVTPPYPSHASNLTCIGASAARMLGRIFRTDSVPLEVTWTATGGAQVKRSYAGFAALADEGAASRVWGGIHFNFELTASHASCRQVADYIFRNYARPLQHR